MAPRRTTRVRARIARGTRGDRHRELARDRQVRRAGAREARAATLSSRRRRRSPTRGSRGRSTRRRARSRRSGRRALAGPLRRARDEDKIDAIVKETLDTFGRIDILINNAGALWWNPVLDTPAKRFDLVMDVNARATFFIAQACLPAMIAAKWGHIVNMSPPIDLRARAGARRVPHSEVRHDARRARPRRGGARAQHRRERALARHHDREPGDDQLLARRKDQWRKADIISDSTLAIVEKPPALRTGKALLDEEVLARRRDHGLLALRLRPRDRAAGAPLDRGASRGREAAGLRPS